MADSPTARALVALDVIQSRPGVTASVLADRLGVTERAVRRYVEILRDADIPVVSVRGRYGGYRIGRSAPPEDLDAIRVLEENLGQGWPLSTRVRFHAQADDVRPWIRSAMGTLEPDGDECVLVGSTNNPEMYAGEWLAPIPLRYVVEGGDELRNAVRTLANRLRNSVTAKGRKVTPP